MNKPRFIDDEVFRAIRAGDSATVARHLEANGRKFDFTDADFRGTDFRNVDVSKVVLRGAYLKDADFRGVDLRDVDLEGCSLHNAKVGGTFFPENLDACELTMSMEYGTRLRVRKSST